MAIWVQKTTSEWQIRVCSFSCKLLEGHLQMIADDCLCSGFEKLQIGGRRLETAAGYLYNLFSLTYSLRLINQRRWCLGLRLRIHDHWRWRRSNHFKRQNSHTTAWQTDFWFGWKRASELLFRFWRSQNGCCVSKGWMRVSIWISKILVHSVLSCGVWLCPFGAEVWRAPGLRVGAHFRSGMQWRFDCAPTSCWPFNGGLLQVSHFILLGLAMCAMCGKHGKF